MSRPLGSTPTPASRSFIATYEPVRQRAPHRYSVPSVAASARSLSQPGTRGPVNGCRYRRPPSHVPCKSRRPGSRRLRAGHRLANDRVTARLIPGAGQRPPVSMPLDLTALQQRHPRRQPPGFGALERLPGPHLTRSCRAFSLTLTTTVFSQRSSGWFDACSRKPTPKGQRSFISRTAPLSERSSYMGPPSAFMTHCPRMSAPRPSRHRPEVPA